jgi:hypothetical protein
MVALGLYVAVGLPLAWLPTNLPRYAKRTYATGYTTPANATIPIVTALPRTKRGPSELGYKKGDMTGVMWVSYRYINKRRAQGLEDEKISSLSEQDIQEMLPRTKRGPSELGYKKGDMTPLMFPKVSCKPVA